ncbi:hypothetical protein WG907_02555 [Sphingobium sp. AN558]|uniref:hypothetical protein n=1 Tax=Sphingobium sp. AN558 TaxID=3133442 RepID=UPI0030BF9F56
MSDAGNSDDKNEKVTTGVGMSAYASSSGPAADKIILSSGVTGAVTTHPDDIVAELTRKLESLSRERDEYHQELFESNRAAAVFALQRQTLVDEVNYYKFGHAERDFVTSTQAQINVRNEYIGFLEDRIWNYETERVRLLQSVTDLTDKIAKLDKPKPTVAPAPPVQNNDNVPKRKRP